MHTKKWLVLVGILLILGLGWYGYVFTQKGGSFVPASSGIPLGQQNQTAQQPAQDAAINSVVPDLEVVAQGLEVPWSIVFTDQDRILITERPGRIRVFERGQLVQTPLITFPEVSSTGEEGLMGIVLHPSYTDNKEFFVCLAYPIGGEDLYTKIVRLRDSGTKAVVLSTLVENIPAAKFHAGCELGFGPDGKLYATTGDATDSKLAQQADSLAGKILRLNPDGSVPDDNPTPGSLIYSMGHRNPQGLAWHPETGELFSTEHGPSGFDGPLGGDEVNVIQANGNYGWPEVSHQRTSPDYISPLLVYTPAVAPGSATFYTGEHFPAWRNSFFFAALKGEAVYRLRFSYAIAMNAGQESVSVQSQEKLDLPDIGRIREVIQGPDGFLYIATSNRDGRGTVRDGDDTIYRIVRK